MIIATWEELLERSTGSQREYIKAHQERVKHKGVLVVTIYKKHHFMTRAASQLAIPTQGMHRMDRCTDVARLIHVILKQYLNMIEYKVIMIFFFLILPFFRFGVVKQQFTWNFCQSCYSRVSIDS